MNKLTLIVYPLVAVLSLAAAVSAHAESPTLDDSASQVWSQTKTRAQVQAELVQARADGSIKAWSTSYDQIRAAGPSLKTRDEVRAQVLAERVSDHGTRLYGEDSGSFYLSQIQPGRDASRVLAGAPAKAAQ